MKKELKITIDGKDLKAEAKKFSTGKEGYGLYGKIKIDDNEYQIVCNIIKLEEK
jgi:hypothetical protein